MTGKSRAFRFVWEQAVRDAQLGATAAAVAFAFATYANADGTSVRPGDKRVADGLGVSLSTVERATRRLRDEGWLTKVRDRNHRAGQANEYRLTLPDHPSLVQCDATATDVDHPSPASDHPSADPVHPSPLQGSPLTGDVPQTQDQLIYTTSVPTQRTATATKPGAGPWTRAAQQTANRERADSVAPPSGFTRPSLVESATP